VTKSPSVSLSGHLVSYLISFALPRYCDQSLHRARKGRFYHPDEEAWMAKLDTVIHELYHVSPDLKGIRRIERGDGTYFADCHGQHYHREVADMVQTYLASGPDPEVYEFLRHDFDQLQQRFGGVVGTTFRMFPSSPQRYVERLTVQPPPPTDTDLVGVAVEEVRPSRHRERFSEGDLHIREFGRETSRRLVRTGAFRAA